MKPTEHEFWYLARCMTCSDSIRTQVKAEFDRWVKDHKAGTK